MTRALYPGTFDPITNGHLDIIERASKLFDSLTIAVAPGVHKDATFSLAERKRLVEECARAVDNVEVVTLEGLLAEQCKKLQVDVVIRGLRAVSDFEYEMMMALMNRKLYPLFETVFLMPSARYVYLHSSTVREVFLLGGDVSDLVPQPVSEALRRSRGTEKK
ncbi:MAG: pantetheine-phosphate adenylyltransferase [Candidatus Krumholzibacteriia bacterium]